MEWCTSRGRGGGWVGEAPTFQVCPAAHHGGLDSTAKRTWTSCRGQRTTHLGAGGRGESTRTGRAWVRSFATWPIHTTKHNHAYHKAQPMPTTKHNLPTNMEHAHHKHSLACAHTPASERWEQQNSLHKQLDLGWQARQEQARMTSTVTNLYYLTPAPVARW
jgi:hypothetical protein